MKLEAQPKTANGGPVHHSSSAKCTGHIGLLTASSITGTRSSRAEVAAQQVERVAPEPLIEDAGVDRPEII